MRPRLLLFLALSSLAAVARADDAAARFDAAGCRSCHRVGLRGGRAGPDLTLVGVRRPRAWIEAWLKSPRHWKPDTRMPEQGLPDADRLALAAWLSERKGQDWGGARPWDGLSGAAEGAEVYARAGCTACHGPAGRGGHPNPGAHGGVIPALAPLMATYERAELTSRIRRGVTPETHGGAPAAVSMPPFAGVLTDAELDALADYLLSLAAGQPKTDW